MPDLDRGRVYGEVYGKPGVRYEQDHRFFDEGGSPVGESGGPAVAAADDLPNPNSNFETMHWKSLYAMAQSYGFEGPFEKTACINFLQGKTIEA